MAVHWAKICGIDFVERVSVTFRLVMSSGCDFYVAEIFTTNTVADVATFWSTQWGLVLLLHVSGHYIAAQHVCDIKLTIERCRTCIGICACNIIVPESVRYWNSRKWCHTIVGRECRWMIRDGQSVSNMVSYCGAFKLAHSCGKKSSGD